MNIYIISLQHFNYCTASFFVRVDVTNEAIYELVAEPIQESSAGEPQPGEVIDQASEEATNPADLQGKPRSITPTLKLMQCIVKYLCIKF